MMISMYKCPLTAEARRKQRPRREVRREERVTLFLLFSSLCDASVVSAPLW
jgi:hypothetical protein